MRMKTTEYVVDIKCLQDMETHHYCETDGQYMGSYDPGDKIWEKKIAVHEVSEAQARSKAINHGMELHPEIYDVEIVSIKKGQ